MKMRYIKSLNAMIEEDTYAQNWKLIKTQKSGRSNLQKRPRNWADQK
jgi:hypothetical protein